MATRICPDCDGTKYIIAGEKKMTCPTCMGSGVVPIDQGKKK